MRQTLIIEGRLPGMNEYTSAQRMNKYAGANMKRKHQDNVMAEIWRCNLQPVNVPVRLMYKYFEPNKRRDKDNVAAFAHKVIQDALVQSRTLPDDGWDEIFGFSDEFYVDKENPRIEVTLVYGGEE